MGGGGAQRLVWTLHPGQVHQEGLPARIGRRRAAGVLDAWNWTWEASRDPHAVQLSCILNYHKPGISLRGELQVLAWHSRAMRLDISS